MEPSTLTIILLILGIIILTTIIIIALKIPDPTAFQLWTFRIIAGLGAACLGAIIPGFVELGGDIGEIAIRAGGAIALFIIIYLINPPTIVRESARSKK